ncbi:MAG: hypothetical protein P9M15_03300 [Candidatus Electryoneaceae bacterium]|nr:hypothetical protein [Candidatus Electryoneaceae bacterium]
MMQHRLGGLTASTIITYVILSTLVLATGRPNEPIILEHADQMRNRGEVRELIGNVHLRHNQKIIRSAHALYNPVTGKVTLFGTSDPDEPTQMIEPVRLDEPGRTVSADRADYNEFTGDFEAIGNVDMVIGDSVRIRCQRAYYLERDSLIQLYDDIILDNYSDGAQITGRRGRWEQKNDDAFIEGNPVYRLPGSEGDPPDTLIINSRRLYFDRKDHSALFTGDVHLNKGEMLEATADSLHHQPDSDLTFLSGSPVIWRGDDRISGEQVELYYEGDLLERLVVIEDAVALSVAHPQEIHRNRLAGDLITMTMINDTTHVIWVNGHAYGHYHLWNEDDQYQGVNLSQADTIELTVVARETTVVILEGGTSGTFYPPDMVPPLEQSGQRIIMHQGDNR